jgi:DNA-directed RNA polymerase beta' subunit
MIQLDFAIYKQVDKLQEVTEVKIFKNSKHTEFHENGLYSEIIFGPVNKFRCQCGKLFGKLNSGKVCDNCGVLCGDTEGRSNTFAKITFPEGIFVVNPIFKTILTQMLGQSAVKSLLNQREYQTNQENPYYFSLEKHKLVKDSKLKQNEKRIETPISDISDLKDLFFLLREMDEYKDYLKSFVLEDYFLDFIFVNYILVIPPNSRQIIKISPTKILPHPVTKCYIQILKNKSKNSSVSDQLFNANRQHFGYTVYKYQNLTDEVFDEILDFSFRKKESYTREALTGKTVEFSQRAVLVPNPALRPYQIGLSLEAVKKMFLPELLHYLYTKYENESINDENYTIIDFVQYIYKSFNNDFQINIRDEDMIEFLEKYIDNFSTIVERQPVLWRFNSSAYSVARIFQDDIHYPENKDLLINIEEEKEYNEIEKIFPSIIEEN